MSRNLGFKLILSEEDSVRLREILATQEMSSAKQPIWARMIPTVLVFLVLITLLVCAIALGQTEFVQQAVSDLIEAVLKSWGQYLGKSF